MVLEKCKEKIKGNKNFERRGLLGFFLFIIQNFLILGEIENCVRSFF